MTWDRLRASHYAGPVALTCLGVSTIQMFISSYLPIAAQLTLSIVVMAVLVVSIFGLAYHGKRLCAECALHLPLDCEAQAQKKMRRLRFIHALSDYKYFYWGVVAVLVLLCLNTGSVGFCAGLILNLLGMYLILSMMTHSRLQPWCPWCKGRGVEEFAPDLTPRDNQFA